jgi:hypothetical protein
MLCIVWQSWYSHSQVRRYGLYWQHRHVGRSVPLCIGYFQSGTVLLIGLKTSAKAATERDPFEYSKEQFFWSFLVATLLFGISGILSLEQGISSIFERLHHIQNVNISYVILAISASFEGNALRVV